MVIPNPDLKAEYSYNIESGLDQQVGKNIKISLSGYGTFLDNAIVRDLVTINGQNTAIINGVVSELRAQVNTTESYIYGGSVNVVFSLPRNFELKSSFTVTKGKDKTNDAPLRHTTPDFGQITLTYEKDRFKSAFYVEYNRNKFRSDMPITEVEDKSHLYATHINDRSKDGSPGWYTLNLRASYHLSDHFSLSAALENIPDIHYRAYSSGISAPGRNLIISLISRL